eukprot:2776125-Rhodomonas_salina.1
MQCPVLTQRMVLPSAYAMPSTNSAYRAGIRLISSIIGWRSSERWIKYVIDCGAVKQKQFNAESGMESLVITP